MKIQYTNELHLSAENKTRLLQINSILEEYKSQDLILTLRQLYYQLVSADIIPNLPSEYSKLSILLGKGRMAGIVDWDSIEDRVRVPKIPYNADCVSDALNDIISQYRLDRMRDQNVYIEVWIEKDALSGIISKVTNKYHCRLMVNRGYSSITAMHDAAIRFKRQKNGYGKTGYIIYLGDHDPSGMDMVRDIGTRLKEFGVNVDIIHAALLDEQIQKYNPPPNPAKVTDPRADKYIAKYGRTSWEVDALKPNVLMNIVDKEIQQMIDNHKYRNMLLQEKIDIAKMERFRDEMEGDI
jgi:hypothetical protein